MSDESPHETELKLELAEGDLPRLRRHPRVRALSRGRARTLRLASTYFDTADLDLRAAGAGVRIRKVGRRRVQTVKRRDTALAGLFSRGEWECFVRGDAPDLAGIPDPALRDALLAAVGGKPLVPMLVTSVRRTRRVLADETREILFDLDVGEIHTPGQTLPICELELELVRGQPADLYDLALELHASVPLHPSLESKAERGFAALKGAEPRPRPGRKAALSRDDSVDEALGRILAACVDQLAANAPAAREGKDPEGVHQLRVGVRRLRSAFSLFRDWLPAAERAALRSELRWLGDVSGRVRDLDVFLDETLAPVRAALPDELGVERLWEAARAMREEHRADLCGALASPRFSRLLLSLGRLVAARPWRDAGAPAETALLAGSARTLADALLDQRLDRVRRLGTRLPALSAAEKHQLRIQVKKLRYAAEFFRGLRPGKRSDRMIRRLARLQDVLGHLNDRATADAVLSAILSRMGEAVSAADLRAAGLVAGWSARGAEEALGRLARRWSRFARTRPYWRG